jgi:small subunit ribosomal protein S1
VDVDAKGATVQLADGVEGYIRASDISRDRVEDARSVLKVGDEIEAKFVGIDRKNRTISLSIKAKDSQEEAEVMSEYTRAASAATPTLGDLLKEQLGRSE